MNDLFYTDAGEWVRLKNGTATVGLTARDITGDVVYIELPEVDQRVTKGQPCARVEAIKSTADVHAPVGGVVTAVNDMVFDDPDVITRAPLDTWLFRLDCGKEPDMRGLNRE